MWNLISWNLKFQGYFVSPGWFTGWPQLSAAVFVVLVLASPSCRVSPWWLPTSTSSSLWRRQGPSSASRLLLRRCWLHLPADRGSGDESWLLINNLPVGMIYFWETLFFMSWKKQDKTKNKNVPVFPFCFIFSNV